MDQLRKDLRNIEHFSLYVQSYSKWVTSKSLLQAKARKGTAKLQ